MGDHYDYLCVPPAGACGIEHPHGERLVLACCAAPDVCPERVLLESSVYMGNGWLMCDHLCLDRLPMESSAYIANGWFCFSVMLWLITLVVCATTECM